MIQTGEVVALGDTRGRKVDVHMCMATHRDLRAATLERRFREDLYYRIGRPELRVPPLRERRVEIPWLVELALAGLPTPRTAHALTIEAALLRPWPGNIRELILELQTAAANAALEDRAMVLEKDLAPGAGLPLTAAASEAAAKGLDDPEQVAAAMRASGGNISAAARALGVHRTQLRRWLERSGAQAQDFTADDDPGAASA